MLNDASWHNIEVSVDTTQVTLRLHDNNCVDDVMCMSTHLFPNANSAHNLDLTYVGIHFLNDEQQQVFQDRVGFVGCARDVIINDVVVVPEEFNNNALVRKREKRVILSFLIFIFCCRAFCRRV